MAQIAPEGYTLQACETINATILMPSDWVFWKTRPNEYLATREKFECNGSFAFETGLTIAAIRNANLRSRQIAAQAVARVARRHAESPPFEEGFRPLNDLEIIKQDQQTIFRRQHTTRGGFVMGLHLAPRSYYLSGICIDDSDTAYIATFETPMSEWDIYKPVAEIMIENITIQPGTE